jgi:two-component system, NarL family, sensor histidine kinase DevS
VEAFAEQAELAYEVAQRRRDSELLALFAERDRIARKLHDQVIQRLFATGMTLEGAAIVAELDPPDAVEKVRRAVVDIDATIKELRSTIYALQNPLDAATGLRARVIDVVDAASEALGFPPSVRFDGAVDYVDCKASSEARPGTHSTAARQLLAVLREALVGIARHAEATTVDVTVSARPKLRLLIEDDGIGPSDADRRAALASLAVRAEHLGGQLTFVDLDPGTRLCWNAPPCG